MRKFMIGFCFILMLFILVISVNNVYASKKTIYIDPGHGGIDKGATRSDVLESNINLNIAFELKTILINNGYNVLMTRDGDYDLSDGATNRKKADNQNRVDLINNSDCIMYVSIHQNAYTQSAYSGAQVFYSDKLSINKDLAKSVQDSLKYYLGNTTRIEKDGSNLYLVNNIKKPGFLVECGFMSNAEELELLIDARYQQKIAYAIFYGMFEYI